MPNINDKEFYLTLDNTEAEEGKNTPLISPLDNTTTTIKAIVTTNYNFNLVQDLALSTTFHLDYILSPINSDLSISTDLDLIIELPLDISPEV